MTSTYPFTRANKHETLDSIYEYICKYITNNGYAPSVRDICRGVGLRSTSTVYSHLQRLVADGRIEMDAGKRRAIRVPALESDDTREVALVGTVTAGQPILATENIERTLPLPAHLWKDADIMFALRVRGDSMVNASILDGDIVFVAKQTTADDGDIVVALLDDEATVKTFCENADGTFYLHPENEAYSDIPLSREGTRILGVVRGLMRVKV